MKLHKYIWIVLFIFLFSCAPYRSAEDEQWIASLETLPRFENYYNAGIYGINKKYITQYCDRHGNAKWLRYNNDTKVWNQFRYETNGCRE